MAKNRINAAKLKALGDHFEQGGDTSKESIAACLGGTNRMQFSTIQSYLEALAEQDENFENIAVGGSTLWYDAEDEESEESEPEEPEEDEEEEEEEPEPEPEPEPVKKKKKKNHKFYYTDSKGSSIELMIESQSSNIVQFVEKPVKQIVKIMLKQEIVEVDLIPLRQAPQDEINEHGISNARLLALCVSAQ